jgi:hypothetical protein
MDRDLIRSWLQLPPGDWPPDHYTLLGLTPGETGLARIEQQVHERMQRLRSYQLTHPELATEAMNRLAQALVCLTDPKAKKAYDRQLLPESSGGSRVEPVQTPAAGATPALSSPPALPVNESAGGSVSPIQPPHALSWQTLVPLAEDWQVFDWQTAPPPPRLPVPLDAASKETAENSALPARGAPDTLPDTSTLPSADSGTQTSTDELLAIYARRGPRSKSALYCEIARTRQLLWAWEQVGKYLSRPRRYVSRPAEATDLIHHMGVIRELLPSSTPRLGEAGQPGYLVLALARQQMIVPTLQTLLPSQRAALARDWQTGHTVLRSVRTFLRDELHIVRRRRGWRHVLRLLSASWRNHPGILLLIVTWIALNLARSSLQARWPDQLAWLPRWPDQLICLLGLLGIRFAIWLYTLQPVRIPPAPHLPRKMHLPRHRLKGRHQPNSSHI